MRIPFRYSNTSPEVIRLTATLNSTPTRAGFRCQKSRETDPQVKEAATLLKGALKHNPKDRYPAAALASAYGHLGRKVDSSSAFKEFEAQFPNYSATGHNPVSVLLR